MSARGSVIKRGKTYSVVLDLGRDADGKRIRKWHSGYRIENLAERARTDLLGQVDTGTYVAPTAMTVGEFLDEWQRSTKATFRANTWSMYAVNIKAYIRPALGAKLLRELRPSDLNTMYGELLDRGRRNGKGLSYRAVRIVHVVTQRALEDAVRWGYVGPQRRPPGRSPTRPDEREGDLVG